MLSASLFLLAHYPVSNTILKSINNLTVFSAAEQICISHSLQADYLGYTILFHPRTLQWTGDITSINYINTWMQTTCFFPPSGCYFITIFVISRDGLLDPLPAITDILMIQKTGSGTLLHYDFIFLLGLIIYLYALQMLLIGQFLILKKMNMP